MENKVPQQPPTTRTSPNPPTTNREGSTRSKPPEMQHDSMMKRAIADGAERARTYSANSTHDTNPTVTRSGSHYRSANNVRFREPSLDPLLMASLERPDLEDEAETVSFLYLPSTVFIYIIILILHIALYKHDLSK